MIIWNRQNNKGFSKHAELKGKLTEKLQVIIRRILDAYWKKHYEFVYIPTTLSTKFR